MAIAKAAQPSRSDKRQSILDAAERCFARSGFHQASMNEICVEAGMSPGNLYRYFPSKEAIIEGIAERGRAEAAESFDAVAASPDFFEGLRQLARYHMVERAEAKLGLCIEILAESRRNPTIARLSADIERDIKAHLEKMLRMAASRGEIASDLDFDAAATMLMVLADGMSWQRAANPAFDAERLLPYMFQMIGALLAGRALQPGEKDQ